MTNEDIQKLQNIKNDLLHITTGEEALADLPPDERAAMLIFRIKSTNEPQVELFEQAKAAIDEIEDSSAQTDAALDLMGAIDVATGVIVEDEGATEVATSAEDGAERPAVEAPTSDDDVAEKAQDHGHQ